MKRKMRFAALLCGGAVLAALIIGLLLAVVLAAKPIEDVQLGAMNVENIRCIEIQRTGREKVRLKREQSQALVKLLNGLELERARDVQKCGTQWFAAGARNRASSCSGTEKNRTLFFQARPFGSGTAAARSALR